MPASTTWMRMEASQTYWPKHNLQIGRTRYQMGCPAAISDCAVLTFKDIAMICSHERLVHQQS